MSYFQERRHPRLEFRQFPWVFSLRLLKNAELDRPFRLEAQNISRTGLKFLCNRRFSLFEHLHVNFFEKSSGKALVSPLEGKIVRVEDIETGFGERTYGIAMEFVSGLEELAALLPEPPAKPSEK